MRVSPLTGICRRIVLALGILGFASSGLASDDSQQTVGRSDDRATAPGTVEDGFTLTPNWRQGILFQLETAFAPSADVGGADVSLIRPLARLRLRVPINHRIRLQLTGSFATSDYDVEDEAELFEGCTDCPSPNKFSDASLLFAAGYLLNTERHLLRAGERWALLAAVLGRARWESGAFDDSLTGGGSLGLGYGIPGRLRLALGVRVESKLEGGISVQPEGRLRWNITERWRLRDRSMGLHLGYRPGGAIEYFVEGYRSSESFLLDSRPGSPSDLTFQDRRLVVSAGVEWRAWRALHILWDVGAIVDRRLAIESDGDRLDADSGDPSPYIGLRLEVRP